MRIAQIAPLFESVPPRAYGGTERVVHYLTEELMRQGHEVVLYASGDSRTRAQLRAIVPDALRLAGEKTEPLIWQVLQLAAVAREAGQFDVLHFHTDFLHFPLSRQLGAAQLSTLHGRLDLSALQPVFSEFSDMPLVSISADQRRPLPTARWIATIHNGLPENLYDFQPRGGDYLAFLGRMSPEKGPETAIDIAHRAGIPLRMAAKIDPLDRDYFDARVRPLLRPPFIEFLGEIDERGKNELLGGALALLFPVDWPEPFGLAMIEALACGTPVIAYRRGSVPEIVRDGVTGYIVDGAEAAVAALRCIGGIRRQACRRDFEERFSARRMAGGYLAAYRQLITGGVREEGDETDWRPSPLPGRAAGSPV
jgi:glycosyltransferase involved in cell wall biosynthesis